MSKKNVEKERRKAYLKMVVGILVAVSVIVMAFTVAGEGEFLELGIVAAIALTFGLYFAYQGTRDLKNIKDGMPIEDERSRKVMRFAAAKAYYISLYWLLAIIWFEDLLGVKEPGDVVALGIMGMAIAFGLSYLYARRREDLD